MTTTELLSSSWCSDWATLSMWAALLGAYAAALRFRLPRRSLFFIGGMALLLIAAASPLAVLAHGYLFSAHMAEHLLLVLVVPPLLLLGLPPAAARRALRHPLAAGVVRVLGRPVVGWLSGAAAMWVWHYPPLLTAALHSGVLHLFEQLSLLLLGCVFWWQVAGPLPERRLAPLLTVLYLFTACVACTVLGIILSFAPAGLYPAYVNPADRLGILPLIRQQWGLSPATDQQLGGLLMWVPACTVYLSAVIAVLARWYATPEADAEGAGGAIGAPPQPLPRT